MRIQIIENTKNINIVIPNIILMNSLSALILKNIINKKTPDGKNIKYRDIKKIFKALKTMKKNRMTLVDIQESDGTSVKIKP